MKANNPKKFAKAKPNSDIKVVPTKNAKDITKSDVIQANVIDSVKNVNVERTIANKKIIIEDNE